jgi:hypothetical protein
LKVFVGQKGRATHIFLFDFLLLLLGLRLAGAGRGWLDFQNYRRLPKRIG